MTTEDEKRHERQEIFLREHRAKIARWGNVVPYGIPREAGAGTTQSSDSPGADNGDGLKA